MVSQTKKSGNGVTIITLNFHSDKIFKVRCQATNN